MKNLLLAIGLVIGVCGCSKQTPSPTQPVLSGDYQTSFDSITISDSQIRSLTYSSYKYPNGFYQENLGRGSIYYNNTLSILPLNQRSAHSTELSTNNQDQALAWSESTAINSAYYRKLVSESQTDKYFQFRRVYQKDTNDMVLDRVHKLSYLDRSMFDSFNPTPLIARLNSRPIDSILVQNLVEYLWFVENYDIYGAQVLATVNRQSIDTAWSVIYSLQRAGGDFGLPDEITLSRSMYSVSTQSGNVWFSITPIRTIQGRYN